MRRGFAFLISLSVLGAVTSSAFGQYPYPNPYGTMPVQYGYPLPAQYGAPMPGYAPNPNMARPMQYTPMTYPQREGPKVVVYGPLTSAPTPAQPMNTGPDSMPMAPSAAAPASLPTLHPVSREEVPTLHGFSKAELPPEACGPGADCAAPSEQKYYPLRGKGHFVGEVGAFFLVPVSVSRPTHSTTVGGTTTLTEFASELLVGPRASFGYVAHTGWGVRGGYWGLNGSENESTSNVNPNTTITTASGPLSITSPSATLQAGIGVDEFSFSQRFRMHVADIELLKETSVLDTAFLFSVGARYTWIQQSYTATRINPGGANGVTAVTLDREDISATNRFQGWGPTVSLDGVHPLGCGFSFYGNVRGTFLWGTDRYSQNYTNQNRTTTAGVTNFVDTSTTNEFNDTRYVSAIETEAGLQYGCRVSRCYLFARAGAVFHRWWDVGSATSNQGSLNLVGGTLRFGVTY